MEITVVSMPTQNELTTHIECEIEGITCGFLGVIVVARKERVVEGLVGCDALRRLKDQQLLKQVNSIAAVQGVRIRARG